MQKKFYLLIVFVFVSLLSHAQIGKGTILLGGNISVGLSSTVPSSNSPSMSTTERFSTVNIAPSYGKAVKDNMVLGFDLSYSFQQSKQPGSTGTINYSTYGAGVFMRKYKSLGAGFAIFGETGFGGGYNTSFDDTQFSQPGETQSRGYFVGVFFYPGIAYRVSRHFMLETSFPNLGYINYTQTSQRVDNGGNTVVQSTSKDFSIGSSLSNTYVLTVGLRVLI